MKKFAKMSLVAAVAVAGLTTANAKDLTEAIKGVDVTGSVAYRYEDVSDKTTKGEGDNYYNALMDVTVPAGDDLSMGLSFQAGVGKLPTNGASGSLSVDLTAANFTYSGIANTTITAGLQAIPTPWTVASDALGTTHTGTGILALSTIGPVTLAGAYFNQSDISETFPIGTVTLAGTDLIVLGAIANIAGVNAEAFYIDARDTFDSYTIAAKYKLDLDGVGIAFGARYTELELDGVANFDQDTTHGFIKLTAGMFDASVKYGENGKNGGIVAFDESANTTMEGWNTKLGYAADEEYLQLSIGAKVLPSLHVSLNYNDADKADEQETYLQAKYKASQNLTTYVRLGELEVAGNDGSAGRVHVQYSF